jgi:hypothetical protein
MALRGRHYRLGKRDGKHRGLADQEFDQGDFESEEEDPATEKLEPEEIEPELRETSTGWQTLGRYEHEYAEDYVNGHPVGTLYYTGRVRAIGSTQVISAGSAG